MNYFEITIIILLLIVLIEVSYLLLKTPKILSSRRSDAKILLDTSVLIDGRIISVAKTGFLNGKIIIPKSVLAELQYLADTADHEKRSRARYGLDVVAELQQLPGLSVEILQDGSRPEGGVDERLLELAKKYDAAICTLDFNLNKVALVESVRVLNVNELAQSLRMAHLPGERLSLELTQKGQDNHQAVGYLSDGTMVVVENSIKKIGQTVEVEIIRSLQTAAGRMMFAKQVEQHNDQQNTSVAAPASKPNQRFNKKPRTLNVRQSKPAKNRQPRPPKDAESNLIDLIEHS